MQEIHSQVYSNSQLTLHLNLKNLSDQNILFRPTIEDWVIDDKIMIASVKAIDPPFAFILPQQEIKQTLIVEIPGNLQSGQILRNWLRFPSVQEVAIPLYVTIINPSNQDKNKINSSLSLSIELPTIFPEPNTDPIFSLMSGILDLDKIPSHWLVAELCVKLYQIGQEYSKSSQGHQLLQKLQSTDFFSNGIRAFSLAKIPEWIKETINTIHKNLPYELGKGHLLYIWESWLFTLAEIDHTVPEFMVDDCITQIELYPEQLFPNIILGLAKLSPAIEKRFNLPTISQSKPEQANVDLINFLSGLDLISARWLAVEILVKIAYIGDKSLQTEAEKKLLSRVSSSSFFERGILSFTSAQVPRWIEISHSAITAYYNSLGLKTNSGGLLYLLETWLWNLTPKSLQTGLTTQSQDIDIFIRDLGMDERRWFIAIIFGLKQLCPRINQTLQKIAQQTEILTDETLPFIGFNEDVVNENGSIQR
ncbi:hypothetical protein [Crocosphaera sp. Alani8]|uniref:hypothetical protein n=1 Tax=Crocosphaera sp. Alani8 TaxID=3038952 RepID=UPI00313AADDE